jgi:hypothetical protein
LTPYLDEMRLSRGWANNEARAATTPKPADTTGDASAEVTGMSGVSF